MKRWLLAVAALLFGTVSVSHADYMIIKYNLTAERENPPDPFAALAGAGFPSAGGSGGAPAGSGGVPGGSGAAAGGSGAASGGSGGVPGITLPGMQPGDFSPEDIEITPLFVVAVIDLKVPPKYQLLTPQYKQAGIPCPIIHKWGTTYLKESSVFSYAPLTQANKPVKSIAKVFEDKMRTLHQEKPAEDTWADLAEWTLSHGMLPEFHKVMDEFAQGYADSRFVVAYHKLKAELERPAASNHEADAWRPKLHLDTYKIAEQDKGHFTLIHNFSSNTDPVVQTRLTRMENAFASFYYWLAMRLSREQKDPLERVKVPQERLLAVVLSQPRDFDQVHDLFPDQPTIADAFDARRDNLVVYSAVRRDQAAEDLRNYADSALRGQDRLRLLNGGGNNYDFQALALMEKALEEEGDLGTASQAVPRHLLDASGLLARHVEVPRWVEFGLGSVFATPNGSPWQTLGAPPTSLIESNNYLYTYKVWRRGKKLEDPKTALEKVVTDQYFRLTKGDKDGVALQKARTTAWALNYFLARQRLSQLLDYYAELSRLPRDLEFDDPALLNCFARAFGLLDPKTNRVDQVKLINFAREWDDYISRIPVEFEDAIKELHKTTTQKMIPADASPAGSSGSGRNNN